MLPALDMRHPLRFPAQYSSFTYLFKQTLIQREERSITINKGERRRDIHCSKSDNHSACSGQGFGMATSALRLRFLGIYIILLVRNNLFINTMNLFEIYVHMSVRINMYQHTYMYIYLFLIIIYFIFHIIYIIVQTPWPSTFCL